MSKRKKIAVLGGGSWATALVKILSSNTNEMYWWMRNEEAVVYINEKQKNPNYLSDVNIDASTVKTSSDIKFVCEKADIIILAIPSAFIVSALSPLEADLSSKIFFSAVKGIIPEKNELVGAYIQKKFNIPEKNIGVISGPCHAEEVAMERLSYLTIACNEIHKAKDMAISLACPYIKTTVSSDIYGTEYAAVLKNIISIAAGIAHGMRYGDNYLSVLISNGLKEIQLFLNALYPLDRNITNSAYLGDLLVTTYSKFSRNRTFGTYIGKGYSVKAAQLDMNMVAEGYYAVKCIKEINEKFQVKMPITYSVYRILYEKMSPSLEFKLLSEELS